jgi:hypothetical protein
VKLYYQVVVAEDADPCEPLEVPVRNRTVLQGLSALVWCELEDGEESRPREPDEPPERWTPTVSIDGVSLRVTTSQLLCEGKQIHVFWDMREDDYGVKPVDIAPGSLVVGLGVGPPGSLNDD